MTNFLKSEVEVEIYTICKAQTISSSEGDTSEWHFLATDEGNIWFNARKQLKDKITPGKVMKLQVYRYKEGSHNARTGRKNKHLNVYLDNTHLKG